MLLGVLRRYFFLVVKHKNGYAQGERNIKHSGFKTDDNYLNKQQGKNKVQPRVVKTTSINQAVNRE